jgi:hypothetical protein
VKLAIATVTGSTFGFPLDSSNSFRPNETPGDEGVRGYINPLHGGLPGPLKGPQVYLPECHANGHVDFEW